MCGRYTLTIDMTTFERRFGGKFYIAEPSFDWTPTFNAAPSQMLPIIRTYNSVRIELAKWGFVPERWRRTKVRPQNNARLASPLSGVQRLTGASAGYSLYCTSSLNVRPALCTYDDADDPNAKATKRMMFDDGPDGTVLLGVNLMKSLAKYDFIVMAHEYGHILQFKTRDESYWTVANGASC
jgi:hypothetical protein